MTHLKTLLRKTKHLAFMGRRAVNESRLGEARMGLVGELLRARSKMQGYNYATARYPHTFLANDAPAGLEVLPVPRRLFCMWTGDNDLNAKRLLGLDSIRTLNSDLDLVLITPANLHEWVVANDPLPPAYERLSFVHRADYLRAYLLHHHGGAYTDIKRQRLPLSPHFAEFEDPSVMVVGYPEIHRGGVAGGPPPLGKHMHLHYRLLLGSAVLMIRPHSPFSYEWLAEVNARMGYYAHGLDRFPGNARGDNYGYPVPWFGLLGEIIQPLSLKYQDHIRLHEDLRMARFDYR